MHIIYVNEVSVVVAGIRKKNSLMVIFPRRRWKTCRTKMSGGESLLEIIQFNKFHTISVIVIII